MTVGEKFREKREELGLTLTEISEQTKIQERYLIAIEEDRFDAIPGEYYLKEFVGKYADIVKLDQGKLLAEITQQKINEEDLTDTPVDTPDLPVKPEKPAVAESLVVTDSLIHADDNKSDAAVDTDKEENSSIDKQTETPLKAPLNKKRIAGAIIVLIVLLVGGVYATNHFMNSTETKLTETERVSETTKNKLVDLQETSTSTTTSVTTSPETTTEKATEIQTTTVQTTTTPTQAQQQTTPSYTASGSVYTQSVQTGFISYALASDWNNYTGEYHFVLHAKDRTWVKYTVNGSTIWEGFLFPNASQTFRAFNNAGDVVFIIGASENVTMTMNGRPIYFPTDSRVQTVKFDVRK